MKTKTVVLMALVGAIVVLAVPCVSHAQESKLSEVERRLIYSRAFEVTLWASPVLATYCQAD